MSDETAEVEIAQVRPFLREVFASASADEALRWADDRGLLQDVFAAAVTLARTADADAVVDVVEPKTSGVDAELLVGRRVHLKLRKAQWQLVLSILPLIVGIVMNGVSPVSVTSAITVTLSAIVANLQRIDPKDWPVFLAVKRGAATRADVVLQLRANKTAVEHSVLNLLAKGVIAESGGRLHVVA